MVRKAGPSEEQLRETVQRLLKNASLEDMTMKQICQRVSVGGGDRPAWQEVMSQPLLLLLHQVFDTFPEHDLSSRKDFIKQTVKSVSTYTNRI